MNQESIKPPSNCTCRSTTTRDLILPFTSFHPQSVSKLLIRKRYLRKLSQAFLAPKTLGKKGALLYSPAEPYDFPDSLRRDNIRRRILRCQGRQRRRSRFQYGDGRLPREFDGPELPRADPHVHISIDRELRSSRRGT